MRGQVLVSKSQQAILKDPALCGERLVLFLEMTLSAFENTLSEDADVACTVRYILANLDSMGNRNWRSLHGANGLSNGANGLSNGANGLSNGAKR